MFQTNQFRQKFRLSFEQIKFWPFFEGGGGDKNICPVFSCRISSTSQDWMGGNKLDGKSRPSLLSDIFRAFLGRKKKFTGNSLCCYHPPSPSPNWPQSDFIRICIFFFFFFFFFWGGGGEEWNQDSGKTLLLPLPTPLPSPTPQKKKKENEVVS